MQRPNAYERYGNFIINKSQPLGSGSYGHVWKGYVIGPNQSLQSVAVKESFYQSQNIKEIQTLQILKHPNIVRYIDYKISGNSVFMVMELCESGTLEDLLMDTHDLNTQKILGYYSQIVRGIKFMYGKNILHRDIKPSNFLVKKNKIKIADFGTSKIDKTQSLKTLVGTPLFYSPQLFKMSFAEGDTYTQKSDIWALGLILYLMFNYDRESAKASERLKNSLPWKARNPSDLFKNITNQPLTFKNQNIPEEIQKIIQKMLKIDVDERMSFQQFFDLELFQTNEEEKDNLSQIAEERTINFISRETIGWELLELIQLKESQNTNQKQVQECRQFYKLLIDQLSQIYGVENYELMFELQLQYYQLTKNQQEKQVIINKYYERKNIFEEVMDRSGMQKSQEESLKNQSGILIAYEPKIENIMPLPNEKLVNQCKHFIKCHIGNLFKLSQQCFKEEKEKILFIYDLFTLLTLEKSWQIKRKSKLTIDEYKRTRKAVGIQKIINRIHKASEAVPIN